MAKLKVFVWEDVLIDYTPGLIVVIAKNVSDARLIFTEKYLAVMQIPTLPESVKEDINTEPEVIDLDDELGNCFYVSGGG